MSRELKHYTYDELYIGMKSEFEAAITEDTQTEFRNLSGDINPMHLSDDYAQKRGFQGRIAYGLSVASFYSTLVGVYLPGEHCLFQECSIQWPRPVYIGDILTISGEIVEKEDRFKRLTIKAAIKNQEGKKVSGAKLIVGVIGENED